MVGEVVAGMLAHSLALLSDAAHMLTDAGALAMSLIVLRLAAPAGGREPDVRASPLGDPVRPGERRGPARARGPDRLRRRSPTRLAAGRSRRRDPRRRPRRESASTCSRPGSSAGANRRSLNIEGSFQHILTDLFAFIATAIAGAVILAAGWVRADPVAALLVAAIMFRAAWGLLRDSGRVLLDIAPAGLQVEEIGTAMASHPGVVEVHDLHVWEVTTEFPTLSAHVLVEPGADCHGIRRELEALLHGRFGVDHTTLQVEHTPAKLVQIR